MTNHYRCRSRRHSWSLEVPNSLCHPIRLCSGTSTRRRDERTRRAMNTRWDSRLDGWARNGHNNAIQ